MKSTGPKMGSDADDSAFLAGPSTSGQTVADARAKKLLEAYATLSITRSTLSAQIIKCVDENVYAFCLNIKDSPIHIYNIP